MPILVDRSPDTFLLHDLRGKGKVFVAMDGEQLVGCISIVFKQLYICGKPQTVAYLADIRVHPDFFGSRAAPLLLHASRSHSLDMGVDLVFLMIAAGNTRALALTKGRIGLPRFVSLGGTNIYGLLTSPIPPGKRKYEISAFHGGDMQEVLQLCNEFNRGYNFAPVVSENDIEPAEGPWVRCPPAQLLTARRNGMLVANLALHDLSPARQNIVMGAPFFMRAVIEMLRISGALLPMFTFPRVGEELRMLYLRNVACHCDHQDALRVLIQIARNYAYKNKYSLVSIGLHERDPLQSLVRRTAKFTFGSIPFVTSLQNNYQVIQQIEKGVPFQDAALM
ncbi:GNAT family N-acetyltransferase [Gemmatimonadota bacterium]